MGTIPQIPLLRPEDFPALTAASKGEVEKLFRVLNQAVTAISNAINGGLVISDNVRGFQRTLTFGGGDVAAGRVTFKNTMTVRPSSVTIASSYAVVGKALTALALPGVAWRVDGDTVVIVALGTLDAAKSYQVTFEVRG